MSEEIKDLSLNETTVPSKKALKKQKEKEEKALKKAATAARLEAERIARESAPVKKFSNSGLLC